MLKLNLGCGKAKCEGYINVDIEPSVNPDLVCDFRKGLPFEDNSVDNIILIHTIEHIEEKFHRQLLMHIQRVLKKDCYFICAYPEFTRCAQNYISNYKGMRDFWKHTIYGRQLYPSDYHVALMDTKYFTLLLAECGFINIQSKPEPPPEDHNTILVCQKYDTVLETKDDLYRRELFA